MRATTAYQRHTGKLALAHVTAAADAVSGVLTALPNAPEFTRLRDALVDAAEALGRARKATRSLRRRPDDGCPF